MPAGGGSVMDTVPRQRLLEGNDIGRRDRDRWLLRNVHITIGSGQRVGLVGPTGSGKTLLLRALALLDPLDEGEVRWKGTTVRGDAVPSFRCRCIYLHQRPVLWEGTVESNLRAVFRLSVNRSRNYDGARISHWLETLGRDASFLAKPQRALSGGEQQITALLRAIQLEPEMLLLDEPTSALDPHSTRTVESLVQGWFDERPEDRALIWVTHDRRQAERVADRVLRMERGNVMEADDAGVP